MKCPVCTSDLIVTGRERLQTLEEHVFSPDDVPSLKNKYECSDTNCWTRINGIFWNEAGEKYSKSFIPDKSVYIGGNDAPFGSIGRKLNVEIYKHDENIKFKLGKWVLELDWTYKSNKDGIILSKKPKFKLWVNNTLYISGFAMFWFLIKQHYIHKKFRVGEDYKKDFDYPKHSHEKKDWWRWLAPFILRIVDYKSYNKIQTKDK